MSVDDDRVRADDERRLRQLEHVKGEVRAEVNHELHVEAVQQTPSDANQAADVAKRMKEQAFREVSSSDAALVRARRLKHAAQVVEVTQTIVGGDHHAPLAEVDRAAAGGHRGEARRDARRRAW